MTTLNYPPEPEKRLSPKQQQAVLLLVQGTTIAATAKTIEVSEKSIDNWKKLPAFQEAIREAEDDLYDDAMRLLRKSAGVAVRCLLRNTDSKVSNYVQVQAASKLLDSNLEKEKLNKLEALEAEIRELEQLLREKGIMADGNLRRVK